MTPCHEGAAERISCPQGRDARDTCCPQPEASYPQAGPAIANHSTCQPRHGYGRTPGRPGRKTGGSPAPGGRESGLGLAEDPVHGRATDRALALRHVHAGLRDLHGALEVTLLLALDAV